MKYFTKTARLNVNDIEDRLGIYLNDSLEDEVRKRIEEQIASRAALRHPVLLGIPTLGLAPAMARERAIDEIVRRMARSHVDLGNSLLDRKREQERLALEYYKAGAMPKAMQTVGLSAIAAMADKDK